MKFDKAVEQVRQELLERYKEVIFKDYEVVKMTSNTTTKEYGYQATIINTNNIEVRHIRNRFKEITREIAAVEVVFDIKYPKKRKYSRHEEYFEIIKE